MGAALALLDFGASDFAELSAFISLEDGEAFISPEDDEGAGVVAEGAGVVALGLEAEGDALGDEPEGDDDDCARADDSINPLTAVVTNNFLSIENLRECGCCGFGEGVGHGFLALAHGKTGPLHTNV